MNLRGTTRVLGIFGDPIAHSLSPAMQNAAFGKAGIDAVYVPFHVLPGGLADAVAGLRALNILGVNVTVPHKEAVLPLLDEIDPEARLIGAVNTIVNREGRLCGYNTDGLGFLRSLAEDLQFQPAGKRVLLLGAGGACRAAVVALARAGAAALSIANRTPERGEKLVREFSDHFNGTRFAACGLEPAVLDRMAADADLVVNTAVVGLKGDSFAYFPWTALPPAACLYDMVYGPGGTALVSEGRRRGMRCADGLGMLAGQGEEAFRLWTGSLPPSGVMKNRLLAEMKPLPEP
ncbi:shikimate dehydrogenase (NADP(+)) [Desulfuromonas versatilis]|uniref:Shikimate dehydrogenase (NADP(+)) n=1 Tax=Desulfuromonas versatilis TaxID=2802975 RepID=A0ABN6DWZ0_9BACT|nr:shikimate dehydrogenase [Desulfuromonas versatilis]BCR04658.1 shikimate dehydrogenase (NADP(+)) [Desulfuromonas versatilis]